MGERERGKKVERGKATEQVRESKMKTGREEKEMKPGDPAEAPKTEQGKEWEAATLSPFDCIHFSNCAALKAFIISDFCGVIFPDLSCIASATVDIFIDHTD